jgi:hypothetical protein
MTKTKSKSSFYFFYFIFFKPAIGSWWYLRLGAKQSLATPKPFRNFCGIACSEVKKDPFAHLHQNTCRGVRGGGGGVGRQGG